jgi:hypothetical protein
MKSSSPTHGPGLRRGIGAARDCDVRYRSRVYLPEHSTHSSSLTDSVFLRTAWGGRTRGSSRRSNTEIAAIGGVEVRSKDRRINIFCRPVGAQLGLASGVFLGRESRINFLAALNPKHLGHMHGENSYSYIVTRHTDLAGG